MTNIRQWCVQHERTFLTLIGVLVVGVPAALSCWLYSVTDSGLAGLQPDVIRHLALICAVLSVGGVVAVFALRRHLINARTTELRHDFLSTVSHELKTPLAKRGSFSR